MTPLDEALRVVLAHAWALPVEVLPIQEATGRFLAQDFIATIDGPRFDSSGVDGYAIRTADLQGERSFAHRPLRVVGVIAAGGTWDSELSSGCALRIMTGAPLPAGADAVVMLEDARVQGTDVFISESPSPGANVRRRGEELRAGDLLLPRGTPITPPVVALLASQGQVTVAVRRLPRVAIVTTGAEVVAAGTELRPGQIFDANREGLLAALHARGIRPVLCRHCGDDVESLRGQISEATDVADVVLTTGGVSVGDFDHVREVARAIGIKPVFWKVAVKPGKPTFFGTYPRRQGDEGLHFGLSGNPVGALLSFHQLVQPVIDRMMGALPGRRPSAVARMTTAMEKPGGRLELVRGQLRWSDGQLWVEPIGGRESHMVLGLARADCLLRLPTEVERVEASSAVEVEILQWT